MWMRLIDFMLAGFIREGTLNVTYPDGTRRRYGTGAPEAGVRITSPDFLRRLALSPELTVGEGYVDGMLEIEGDDLHGLLGLLLANSTGPVPGWYGATLALRRLRMLAGPANHGRRSRANVAHHYDLSGELYSLFLDADRQYSCAYFREADMTLEAAQAAKKAHIAAKLRLEPGMRVLDIGCGWGGMALTLARDHGARVTGITLSEEQLAVARTRAAEAGLADRVEFRLEDYRRTEGRFDRIVSVGMFEHVGTARFQTYFGAVQRLLEPHGVALIHTIGRNGMPSATSPWIAKYIFPGGYVPSLSEVTPAIERAGLISTDIEVWRLHYAHTLRHWQERFAANIDRVRMIYDERFCRMWRFYLVSSEMAFRSGMQCVFQFQLARRQDSVPLTRGYLAATA